MVPVNAQVRVNDIQKSIRAGVFAAWPKPRLTMSDISQTGS